MPLASHRGSNQRDVNPSGMPSWQLSAGERLLAIVIGASAFGLLGVARSLEPNPEGLGTHQQLLNLPPCGFRMMFGKPCPSCGMTTSWAYLTRGQITDSVRSNAGGFLLAGATLIAAIWLGLSGVRGRWTVGRPDFVTVGVALAVIVLVTMAHWLIKLST